MSLFTGRRGLVRALCGLCVVLILSTDAALALGAEGESATLTNFQVFEKVSRDAAQEIVAGVAPKAEQRLILVTKAKGAGDADFIFEDALVARMKDEGLSVAVPKPKETVAAPDTALLELSYKIIRLSLAYTKIYRPHWFGSKKVDRLARATVRAELIERRSGSVLAVAESQKTYADSIPYSLLGTVEEKQYEFTRPGHSEFNVSKLVEPLIVAGIVVGLVYLFFSNQSNG